MAEGIKPTETGQPAEVANPVPAVPQVWSARPNPAGKAPPSGTAGAVEAPSPAQAGQPMGAAPPATLANSEPRVLPAQSDRPKVGHAEWMVSETTSPLDYSPVIIATIWPRQRVNNGLSGLTISCRFKHIALSLRFMDDLDVPRWGGIYIDSQIGDQHPDKQLWVWDEQQGTVLLYDGDPVALLQSIPDGEQLRLGVGDSKGARHMATYRLFGLDAVRRKIATACPWPTLQAFSEKRKP